MSRLLRLTSVQACMVSSNKKVYWSCTSVNLFSCQSCTFCNNFSCDCRHIIADSRNSNGLYEETSFVAWWRHLHFELLCLHFLLFAINFRYRNGNIIPFQTKALCGFHTDKANLRFWVENYISTLVKSCLSTDVCSDNREQGILIVGNWRYAHS